MCDSLGLNTSSWTPMHVIIGSNGIEKIINLDLDDSEKKLLMNSADAVLSTNKLLDNIKF